MIRQLKPEKDIERVVEIWLNESKRVHDFIADADTFWNGRINKFVSETSRADGYVYEEDRVIKGFIVLSNTYISELYVDSTWQGRGIGTALLNLAKCCSKSLFLNVYVKNVQSINWYLNRGFVLVGTPYEEKDTKQLKYTMIWPKTSAPVIPS